MRFFEDCEQFLRRGRLGDEINVIDTVLISSYSNEAFVEIVG